MIKMIINNFRALCIIKITTTGHDINALNKANKLNVHILIKIIGNILVCGNQ